MKVESLNGAWILFSCLRKLWVEFDHSMYKTTQGICKYHKKVIFLGGIE